MKPRTWCRWRKSEFDLFYKIAKYLKRDYPLLWPVYEYAPHINTIMQGAWEITFCIKKLIYIEGEWLRPTLEKRKDIAKEMLTQFDTILDKADLEEIGNWYEERPCKKVDYLYLIVKEKIPPNVICDYCI
jgi:hypothetical protein